MKFRDLIIAKDYERIAWRLQREFHLFHVTLDEIIHVVEKALKETSYINLYGSQRTQAWSDQSWKYWFKVRLMFYQMFNVPTTANDDWSEPKTATFHIFFTHLEETPEMLAKLSGEHEAVAKPARHAIGSVTQKLSPINQTAFKVAPPPKETFDC